MAIDDFAETLRLTAADAGGDDRRDAAPLPERPWPATVRGERGGYGDINGTLSAAFEERGTACDETAVIGRPPGDRSYWSAPLWRAADPAASSSEGGTLHRAPTLPSPNRSIPASPSASKGRRRCRHVYIPLLTYAHANGAAGTKLIPGLAKELPKIDQGGKRYTLLLRPGLNTPTARRSKHPTSAPRSNASSASTRSARPSTPASSAPNSSRRRRRAASPGSKPTTRSGKIVIHLTSRAAPSATCSASPTRRCCRPTRRTKTRPPHPPPATGPYVITAVTPGRSWEYGRNPAWAAANGDGDAGLPDGHVDKIKLRVRTNPISQVERSRTGQGRLDEEPAAARPLRGGEAHATKAPSSARTRRSAPITSG